MHISHDHVHIIAIAIATECKGILFLRIPSLNHAI